MTGYVESFNSNLRDELLNRESFLHIDELRYVADRRRMDYNNYRLDCGKAMIEVLYSIKRAGADIIITCFAKEAAKLMG